MQGAKLLVIDDEPGFCESLADWFTPLGCQVSEAHSGLEGIKLAHLQRPDAIILDIRMPGMDGFAVIRALREDETTHETPIIVSSVTSVDLDSRLRGLRYGADYILLKTKDLYELEEVVRRTLGRRQAPLMAAPAAATSDLYYDAAEVIVYRGGERLQIELTPGEANLLHCLWENRNRLTTRDDIAVSVYNDAQNRAGISNEAIDRLVGRLRAKIEPDIKAPRYIQTIRGHGYRLTPNGQPAINADPKTAARAEN